MDYTSYTKEDIKYYENCLYNYFYLKREEQRILKESLEREEDRVYLKGNAYDTGGGSGCSVRIAGSGMDGATAKSIDLDFKLEQIRKAYKSLDNTNQLSKRMHSMDDDAKQILYMIFKRGMNVADVARKREVTPQAIRKKLDHIMIRFMEVV